MIRNHFWSSHSSSSFLYFWFLMYFSNEEKMGGKLVSVHNECVSSIEDRKKKEKMNSVPVRRKKTLTATTNNNNNHHHKMEKANWFTQMRAKWISPFILLDDMLMYLLRMRAIFYSWCVRVFSVLFFAICLFLSFCLSANYIARCIILCLAWFGVVTFAFFTSAFPVRCEHHISPSLVRDAEKQQRHARSSCSVISFLIQYLLSSIVYCKLLK